MKAKLGKFKVKWAAAPITVKIATVIFAILMIGVVVFLALNPAALLLLFGVLSMFVVVIIVGTVLNYFAN